MAFEPPASRALLIDAEVARSQQLAAALSELGASVAQATQAEDGWRCFVEFRPQVVIVALTVDGSSGAAFLRRLQNEFLGAMPRTYFLCDPTGLDTPPVLEPDGILVTPVPREALRVILGHAQSLGETASRQATRLRELYDISLLGADLFAAVDNLAARAALAFQVSDCLISSGIDDPDWPRNARHLEDEVTRGVYTERCQLAASLGAPLLLADAVLPDHGPAVVDGPGRSYLGAWLGGATTGFVCLVSDDMHRFTPDERDALRVLGRRTGAELAWVSAHRRLAVEHEKLRESALLDNLLGVWTRSALEQAIVGQINEAKRQGDNVCLAVLDFVQLRSVNDRYGHVTGDAVLNHFAQTIRANLGVQDLIGRFGGDELALVLIGTDLGRARATLDKLIKLLAATPYSCPGIDVAIEVTAGVTAINRGETTGEGAFARAFEAMRQARRRHVALEVSDPDNDWGTPSELLAMDEGGLPAGSTLGGMYRILHEISRGAMGVVYRGEDLGLGRPVAIKVLRSDLAVDTDLVARFRAEAAMLASLHHVNLVQVYSFGAEGDDVYFVMELVEGEPLSDVIIRLSENDDFIGLEAVEKIVEEIADALEAIHTVGVIHRDVKPANILLDRINDRAALVDVGVAKRRDEAIDAAGTPGFAAPESFMDEAETTATDVYGLASTTYTMLTGTPPFGGGEVIEVVNRQLYETPPLPSELRSDLSSAVDEVLLKALAPNQPDRYNSAAAFAIALSHALARKSTGETPAPVKLARRRKMARFQRDLRHQVLVPAVQDRTFGIRADTQVHQCRGAWFRVAYRLLSHHLGESWVQQIIAGDPKLGEVLTPHLSPTSWQPLDHLVTILVRAGEMVRDPHKLARSLGRITINATLPRFFGADPALQAPTTLLRAAEAYWHRYHSWGKVVVNEQQLGVVIEMTGSPGEPLICSASEGAFGRIAELSGGIEVSTSHPQCLHKGGSTCRFLVNWSAVELTTN